VMGCSSTARRIQARPISDLAAPAPAKPGRARVRRRKKFRHASGPTIAADFKALVIDYIAQRYGSGAKPKSTVTAAE